MSWDWQVFFQEVGDGRTYFQWMMSAWGWTLAVSACALVVALVVRLGDGHSAHDAQQGVRVDR